jgi:hypothetical protein
MQNDGLTRSPHCLSLIAGIALMVAALGFAFFPNIAEAVPDMYVANYGSSTISSANLDGTGGVDLGNLAGTLNGPVGIALDLSSGKMYIQCESGRDGGGRSWQPRRNFKSSSRNSPGCARR